MDYGFQTVFDKVPAIQNILDFIAYWGNLLNNIYRFVHVAFDYVRDFAWFISSAFTSLPVWLQGIAFFTLLYHMLMFIKHPEQR